MVKTRCRLLSESIPGRCSTAGSHTRNKVFCVVSHTQLGRLNCHSPPTNTMDKRAFHDLCIEVLRDKGSSPRQRILPSATRVLYQKHSDLLCVGKRTQLRKALQLCFDSNNQREITKKNLETYDECEWSLPGETTLQRVQTWDIKSIVSHFTIDGEPHYVVAWANTSVPAAMINPVLLRQYHNGLVEKTYIEAQAMVSKRAHLK